MRLYSGASSHGWMVSLLCNGAMIELVVRVGLVDCVESTIFASITTVEADLKRPLAHFKDFLDHVTDHINHYESLRHFNQQVANITKIQTFKDSIRNWRQFSLQQFGSLSVDIKPRGSNAYHVKKGKKGKGKGKGDKGKGKSDKGNGCSSGRFVYWDSKDAPAPKRQRINNQASSAGKTT
jgi:hypothetical protein